MAYGELPEVAFPLLLMLPGGILHDSTPYMESRPSECSVDSEQIASRAQSVNREQRAS